MNTEQIDHAERVENIGYWHKLHGFEDALNAAFGTYDRAAASAAVAEYLARRDPYGLLD
jgi:hypothetical protein